MNGPGYQAVVESARAHHSPASFSHAVRVAEAAGVLAERHGVDPDLARLAGLLHDWARDLPPQTLLDEARRRGMAVAPVDLEVPYLLHARLGRLLVSEEFPTIGNAVLDAIAHHTCGADDMSDLEKIVYVADMIEEGRRFDGVDELREAVAESTLDEAFRLAYVRSVEHLVRTRRHLHPDTVAVWNAHVAGERDPS